MQVWSKTIIASTEGGGRDVVRWAVTSDPRARNSSVYVGENAVGKQSAGQSEAISPSMYLPERGRVLIDGVDLVLADSSSLRRQICVVLQENVLFNRTVRENIALSNPGLPMEAVTHAAKLAGAHDFILELPEGYDTLVGEQGSTLSGRQRQRIAKAHAQITNPRILIFNAA